MGLGGVHMFRLYGWGEVPHPVPRLFPTSDIISDVDKHLKTAMSE